MKRQYVTDIVGLKLEDFVGKQIDSIIDHMIEIRDQLKMKYSDVTFEIDYNGFYDNPDGYYFNCKRLETDIEVAVRKEKLQKSKARHMRDEEKAKENRLRQYKKLKKEFGEPEL